MMSVVACHLDVAGGVGVRVSPRGNEKSVTAVVWGLLRWEVGTNIPWKHEFQVNGPFGVLVPCELVSSTEVIIIIIV